MVRSSYGGISKSSSFCFWSGPSLHLLIWGVLVLYRVHIRWFLYVLFVACILQYMYKVDLLMHTHTKMHAFSRKNLMQGNTMDIKQEYPSLDNTISGACQVYLGSGWGTEGLVPNKASG